MAENKRILGFYHICCLGLWKLIVKDQIDNLCKSPLYEKIENIYVCIIVSADLEKDIEYCKLIFPDKFIISIIEKDLRVYEFPILRLMKDKSSNEEFYGFYFHSKGVSVKKNKNAVMCWRKELEYFIFHKCDLMIDSFKGEYNTYGPNLRGYPKQENVHFGGNFWAAKSEYIRELPTLPLFIDDRYCAEVWIGKSESMNPYVPFNSNIDLYHIPLPRLFYNKSLPIHIKDLYEITLFSYYYVREHVYKKTVNCVDYLTRTYKE